MFDGSIKSIAEVANGNVLMGPDSAPRTVRSIEICDGTAFEVRPLNGDSFILGDENYVCLQGVGQENCRFDLHVSDFEKQSKHFKVHHKLYRSGVRFAIESQTRALVKQRIHEDFAGETQRRTAVYSGVHEDSSSGFDVQKTMEAQFGKSSIDPYFLGSLLADGSFRSVPIKLSCGDIEPCRYAQKIVESMGLVGHLITRKNEKCFDVFAGTDGKHGNILRVALQELGLWDRLGHQKFIPDIYKTGSENVRLSILAGLIDADGNLSWNNSVSYCTASRQLAEDTAFIARSLGFGVSVRKPQIRTDKNWRPIYTICIFGDFSRMPLLVTRKIPNPRRSPKNVLRTGLTVQRLDSQITYRKLVFEGRDQHYLKSDFMVMKGGSKYVI
jgi:hypothetical protein